MVEPMRISSGAAAWAISMFIAFTACAVRPPTVARDDAAITSDVRARLAADPQTKPFAITVDTKAGVVHVGGDVAKDADRQAVERIAQDAPGVQGVENNVRYGGVPAPAEPSVQ